MATHSVWAWGVFSVLVLFFLALDLKVFHKTGKKESFKGAVLWSIFWIALAMGFNVGVLVYMGSRPAMEFLTGYILEKALSVDNLFVFIVIFDYFATPASLQHRALFFGVVGAIFTRAAFILVGGILLDAFHVLTYVLAGFLILTGARLMVRSTVRVEPQKNPVFKLFQRLVPCLSEYRGKNFLVRERGRILATPLLLVVVVLEATDIVFAVDSIPAVFGVTRDPFIVYTSNIWAVLGLRALYFVLAGSMRRFVYLRHGLSLVLVFIGVKMGLADMVEVPIQVSLPVVASVLGTSVVLSIVKDWRTRGRRGLN